LPDDPLGDRRILFEERPPLCAEGAQLGRHGDVVNDRGGAFEGVELSQLAIEGRTPALPASERLEENRGQAGEEAGRSSPVMKRRLARERCKRYSIARYAYLGACPVG
jgi:hypothetical protein